MPLPPTKELPKKPLTITSQNFLFHSLFISSKKLFQSTILFRNMKNKWILWRNKTNFAYFLNLFEIFRRWKVTHSSYDNRFFSSTWRMQKLDEQSLPYLRDAVLFWFETSIERKLCWRNGENELRMTFAGLAQTPRSIQFRSSASFETFVWLWRD